MIKVRRYKQMRTGGSISKKTTETESKNKRWSHRTQSLIYIVSCLGLEFTTSGPWIIMTELWGGIITHNYDEYMMACQQSSPYKVWTITKIEHSMNEELIFKDSLISNECYCEGLIQFNETTFWILREKFPHV